MSRGAGTVAVGAGNCDGVPGMVSWLVWLEKTAGEIDLQHARTYKHTISLACFHLYLYTVSHVPGHTQL